MLAILALSFLMGMAIATSDYFNSDSIKRGAGYNMTFDFEQSVQGSGYFMTYRYIQLPTPDTGSPGQKGPMYKDYAHGSGTIENEMIINADIVNYVKKDGCYQEWEAYSCISAREDNSMVYSPMRMAIGNGYYARNPILYDSLLKEKTVIKNYRPVTMMHHQVEYAKAVDKEIEILVKDKQYVYDDPIYQGVGYTWMKISEDVTDGMVDIGVLQGDPNNMNGTDGRYGYVVPESTAWRRPMIEIDEHYVGTFTIEKNMTLEVPYKHVIVPKDWLSCCFGGCDTMEPCGTYNPCEPCIFPGAESKAAPTESSYFEPAMNGYIS
jgi:hypothetical protein